MGVRTRIVLAMLALAVVPWPQAGAMEFTCAMSGEVSSSCCCGPRSSEGCASLERACSCCEVSITAAVPVLAPAMAASAPVVLLAAPLEFVAVFAPAVLDVRSVSGDRALARSSLSLFLLNQSFRC